MTLLRDRNPYMEAVWTAHTKHRDGCSFSSHSKLTVSVAFFFFFFAFFSCMSAITLSVLCGHMSVSDKKATK